MPSLERFIKVLRLFDEHATTWTVSAMAETLGVPQSTIYRTVRSLLVAGMLEAATEGRYRLGPAFIAFDRLIRLSDPLVEAGRDVLRDVAADAGVPCVALLSRLYNDTVMCIAEESVGGVIVAFELRARQADAADAGGDIEGHSRPSATAAAGAASCQDGQ